MSGQGSTMAQAGPTHDLSAFLPLDYQVFAGKAVMQYISAPEAGAEAFISQTEKRLIAAGSARRLAGVARPDWETAQPLAGLIFHGSRCGSTLLCNMLDCLADCYTVRESPVLNKVLFDRRLTPQLRRDLFHNILIAYNRYATFLAKRCVIKLTSYCTSHLGFIREQLPRTPWLYLHREPQAVLRSLMKKNAGWQRKGKILHLLNVAEEESAQPLSRLTARVLRDGFTSLLDNLAQTAGKGSSGLVFDYGRLMAQTREGVFEIAQHFGFGIRKNEQLLILACLQIDSKTGKPRDNALKPTEGREGYQDGISTDMQQEIEQASLYYCQVHYEQLRRLEAVK